MLPTGHIDSIFASFKIYAICERLFPEQDERASEKYSRTRCVGRLDIESDLIRRCHAGRPCTYPPTVINIRSRYRRFCRICHRYRKVQIKYESCISGVGRPFNTTGHQICPVSKFQPFKLPLADRLLATLYYFFKLDHIDPLGILTGYFQRPIARIATYPFNVVISLRPSVILPTLVADVPDIPKRKANLDPSERNVASTTGTLINRLVGKSGLLTIP